MRTVRNALNVFHSDKPASNRLTRSNLHASATSGRTFYLLRTLGTALYHGKGKADAAMKSLGMTSG